MNYRRMQTSKQVEIGTYVNTYIDLKKIAFIEGTAGILNNLTLTIKLQVC